MKWFGIGNPGDPRRERRRHASGDAQYADIQIELTKLWFRGLLPTIVQASLGMVGSSLTFAWATHDALLFQMAWVMGAVCVGRIALVAAFTFWGSRNLTLRTALLWLNWDVFGNFCFCIITAVITEYDFQHHTSGQLLCTIGILALCAGMSARIGVAPWKMNVNASIPLATLTYSLYRSNMPHSRMCILLILFFAVAYREMVAIKFQIVVEQVRGKHQLRALAEQDTLTGLANRRLFCERLEALCTEGQALAVLYIDLDRFKSVNDTLGHAAGDALLKQVAGRLRHETRSTDLVARLGGDEFAIVQAGAPDRETTEALARRINVRVAEPFQINEQQVSIGASIGIRMSSAADASPDRLLSSADDALYRVKQAGRGSFSFAEP